MRTWVVIIVLLVPLLLAACGGGGSGGSTSDPAEGSNWDQMEWNRGEWA